MSEVYTYNATHLTTVVDGTVELTQCAELGAVGTGRFTVEDVAGTISIVGQKDFAHTESACATPLTFRGYIADRSYKREADPKVSASREIEVELVDLNAMLGFRLIDGDDGNRTHRETIAERAAWLMASGYVSGLFSDLGRCTFSASIEMTIADYRNQYPGDVLADMALASGGGTNYHVNDYGSGAELTFRNDNTSTADSSTLRISNVLADASGVTLHPFKDAVLRRSPADVYSKIAFSYAKSTIYEERTATATAFNGERGGQASNSNVNTAAESHVAADDLLRQHSSEEDSIECTVLATSAQVNLMPPGWRIEAKFSHLNTEGYGSFTWFRILEVTKKPIVADGGLYEVRLKLSPQETAAVAATCADLYSPTPSGSYYPLGGYTDSQGFTHPNVSDGVTFYWRGGFQYPASPDDAGLQGSWHFGLWAAGGSGTIDYAGDCTGNRLIFIVIGNGTFTCQTEQYLGQVRALSIRVRDKSGVTTRLFSRNSGQLITYEIDDTSDGDCLRLIEISDKGWACGSKWGWSAMNWTAA